MSQLPGRQRCHLAGRQRRPADHSSKGALVAIAGFLVGLLLAYLVELHRRYNAQWSW